MNRKPYSAGAVKFSFWFIEFRKTVQLLAEGKSFSEIKLLISGILQPLLCAISLWKDIITQDL